jgi:hypothetical protein
MEVANLINQIDALPADWHGAGSVGANVLRTIAQHTERIGAVRNSAETGSGKTTLLFSHLSANHLVFAKDVGNSIRQVRNSPLFQSQNVTFIEGPTQETLPAYRFQQKFQLALLDGPHGYPFPDLEYFYFYPQIESGGLLLIDDIKIPTINRMFEIIKGDDMFRLLEVVDDNMAFFERTEVPCINPSSDSWWLQGYNKPYYLTIRNPSPPRPTTVLLRAYLFSRRLIPRRVKALIPQNTKKRILKAMQR